VLRLPNRSSRNPTPIWGSVDGQDFGKKPPETLNSFIGAPANGTRRFLATRGKAPAAKWELNRWDELRPCRCLSPDRTNGDLSMSRDFRRTAALHHAKAPEEKNFSPAVLQKKR
jgi:hypothetical protein